MAKKSEVQYIRYYTVGSAARKLAPQVVEQPKVAPRPRKAKKIVLYIDPVAVLAFMTCVVMVICLLVGTTRLMDIWTQQALVQHHVERLIDENHEMREKYNDQVDLEEIEKTALALGMVPVDQVEHISLGD